MNIAALFLSASSLLGQATPPATESALAKWIEDARPDLEKALGYPLPNLPKFQITSAAQLRQVPDADVATHLHFRFPHLKEEAGARALEDARAVSNAATIARLLEGSNVILVARENQKVIASWDKALEAAAGADFLKLALVHETIRFVLDRRHDLARRRQACADVEEWCALQALVEGRAQWVTRELARKRGMEAVFPLLAERFLRAPDVSSDPGLRTMSQSALRQRHWAITHGMEFYSYLQDQGWSDIEKRVFSQPPRLMAWIDSPAHYVRAQREDRPGLAVTMQRLKTAMPGQAATEQAWTPDMVKQVADLLNEKARADKVLAGWEEGRSLLWLSKTGGMVAVSVARFETPSGARGYFNFAIDLQRKQDELSNKPCGLPLRVLEARSRSVNLPGVEEAAQTDKKLQAGDSKQVIAMSVILARVGDRVLEITWHGLPADLDWAELAVGLLLKK